MAPSLKVTRLESSTGDSLKRKWSIWSNHQFSENLLVFRGGNFFLMSYFWSNRQVLRALQPPHCLEQQPKARYSIDEAWPMARFCSPRRAAGLMLPVHPVLYWFSPAFMLFAVPFIKKSTFCIFLDSVHLGFWFTCKHRVSWTDEGVLASLDTQSCCGGSQVLKSNGLLRYSKPKTSRIKCFHYKQRKNSTTTKKKHLQ